MPLSAKTQLLGILGWPVRHSFSPAMHNAAAAALALDLAYVPLPVAPAHLEDALRGLVALNFLGANVTVPHKQAVLPFLQTVEPAAQAIGAVNTIKITSPHSLSGSNTDWSGFLAALRQHDIPTAGRDCLVLGAGGSARAVVYALARSGGRHCGRITVFARRPAQARQLVTDLQPHLGAAELRAAAWDQLPQAQARHAPLIVNTTPVGMHPNEEHSPWPDKLPFPEDSHVVDLIYNPIETQLLQQARAAGCRVANGLSMLLYQGAHAFELWTGIAPPLEVMAEALRREGIG